MMACSNSQNSKKALINEIDENDLKYFRRIAFFAVALSTVTMLACIILIPILYEYIHHVQSSITNDIEFCRSRNRDLWFEYIEVQQYKGDKILVNAYKRDTRSIKNRQWLFGRYIGSDSNIENAKLNISDEIRRHQTYGKIAPSSYSDSSPPSIDDKTNDCCACEVGLPGPQGDPGQDGLDGKDGKPGEDGIPGQDALQTQSNVPCIRECQPGPQGVPGPEGDKGPKGYPGEQGEPGRPGKPGPRGPQGKQGLKGIQGLPGRRGDKGEPGKHVPGISPPGLPGRPGEMGPPGPPGLQGLKGKAGEPGPKGPLGDQGNIGPYGKPGPIGPPGLQGEPGKDGSCNHCPVPRVGPGY